LEALYGRPDPPGGEKQSCVDVENLMEFLNMINYITEKIFVFSTLEISFKKHPEVLKSRPMFVYVLGTVPSILDEGY